MKEVNTTRGTQIKITARNVLKGKVKKIVHSAVNLEITVELQVGPK